MTYTRFNPKRRKPWHDGWQLLTLVCFLTALTYATQSYWPVLGLLCLIPLTIPCGTYQSKNLGATPKRILRERHRR